MLRIIFLSLLTAAATRSRSEEPGTAGPGEQPAHPAPAVRPPPVGRVELRATGIYPVYEMDGAWAAVERGAAPHGAGTRFLVVGSRAADVFQATRAARVSGAACDGKKPVRAPAYLLEGKSKGRVGVPIIAIRLSEGARLDPAQARFSLLENQVDEETYASLDKPLREAAIADLASGELNIGPEDQAGAVLRRDPRPDKLLVKIDFASKLRLAGAKEALALVEGTQAAKTFRRCLRLAKGARLAGGCAEMPHALMAETNALKFVAYDPSGSGRPFVLAYTAEPPLWGHERWGFRISPDGPRRFLMDALDPKCRDRF